MKKLKDFLYDKNDILLALCILIVAGLLIVWRIDAIMAYPDTLIDETSTAKTTEKSAIDSKGDAKAQKKNSKSSKTAKIYKDGTLKKDVTVSLEGGSVTSAVNSLIDAGLFDSYEEFEDTCVSIGVSPDAIKAAEFTFKKGSTKSDIAVQVTQ